MEVLTLSQNDLLSRLCSNTLYQKFLLTVSQTPSFTDSQLYNLQLNIAMYYNLDTSRVNITQRQTNANTDGEIVVSISKSNGTGPEHSSIVYNFTQLMNQNISKLLDFLSNTNINNNSVKLNTLTFNETVGTSQGCYVKDPSSIENLFIGPNTQCYSSQTTNSTNSQNPISQNPINDSPNPEINVITTITIGVVIGMVAAIILVIGILMLIPGTRRAIFAKQLL